MRTRPLPGTFTLSTLIVAMLAFLVIAGTTPAEAAAATPSTTLTAQAR